MATVSQLEPFRMPAGQIEPELRSWIDNCIVPILVAEYLNSQGDENALAHSAGVAAQSSRTVPAEGVA